jgi:hypothetical protein
VVNSAEGSMGGCGGIAETASTKVTTTNVRAEASARGSAEAEF